MKKKYIVELDEGAIEFAKNFFKEECEDFDVPIVSAIANATPCSPSNDCISREALRKAIHNSNLSGNREWLLMELDKIIDNAPTVEPRDNFDLGYVKGLEDGKQEADKWIKITYRPMTKKEEIEYKKEFGIEYCDALTEYENKVFTCELPNDKQDILIQTNWGVMQDTCDWSDGYCGLEENGDWDGVIAWRPTPEYKESEGE